MSTLEDVAGVKFDCQTATVTMKGDRSLAKDDAEKALKDAGFGVKTFESGAGMTVAMLQTRVDGFAPDQRDALLGALMTNVKDVASASISDGGDLILVMRVDAHTDAETINTALEPVERKVKGVENSNISVGYQRYSVELSSVDDAARTQSVVAAVDGVLAVIVMTTDKKLELITPEPCSNLEAKLAKALEPLHSKVTKLEPL